MSDSIILPKIIADLEWSQARQILEREYDLSIDETDKLFCVKYTHDSRLWTRGTEQQKLMLTQNRGTIYEKTLPYRLICLPFNKFWNYTEPQAPTKSRNWNHFTEKLDGSFFKLYYYEDQWNVSSNSKIDIKQFRQKYIRSGKTNEQLWNEAATQVGLDYSKLNKEYVYFFERVHPDYQIVVKYDKPMLYHLGTRDMSTLQELDQDIGIPKPRSFQFSDLDQCLKYVNQMSFMEGEGIVACDLQTFDRIKIKSPSYLIVHYRTIGIDNHQKQKQFCLSIWLQGEQQEFLNYFPQYIQDYQTIEYQIEQSIINNLIQDFTKLFSNETKEFYDRLNNEYPSSGKPNQDRKRSIFNQLFQEYQWNQLDEEQKSLWIKKILRQRNANNHNKFIFEKYLRSLLV